MRIDGGGRGSGSGSVNDNDNVNVNGRHWQCWFRQMGWDEGEVVKWWG